MKHVHHLKTWLDRLPAKMLSLMNGKIRSVAALALFLTLSLTVTSLAGAPGGTTRSAGVDTSADPAGLKAENVLPDTTDFEIDSLDLGELNRSRTEVDSILSASADSAAVSVDVDMIDASEIAAETAADTATQPSALAEPEAAAAATAAATAAPKPAVTAATTTTTRKTTVAAPAAGSGLSAANRQAIVSLASSFLGRPYVFGGMSPSGFDCSGLTAYIYSRLFHVTLPHSALSQSRLGRGVAKSAMQVGDIICFDWDSPHGSCDHVGIYIGGGQYIHAAHSRGRVVQSTLRLGSDPILTVRRFIG